MKRQDLLALTYYDKQAFTGSIGGLRYKVEKYTEETCEDEIPQKFLRAAVWHGQFAFDHTPEEDKTFRNFEYSEEGLSQIADWINEAAS